MDQSSNDLVQNDRVIDELAKCRAMLDALFESSEDLIYVKDRAGRFLLANPALLRSVGMCATQISGKTDLELFTDLNLARSMVETDLRVMGSGLSVDVEETAITPSGPRIYRSKKTPWRDATGDVIGLIGISRDITDRKHVEQSIVESDNRYRTLVEMNPDAVVVHRSGQILYANAAAIHLYGAANFEQFASENILHRVHPESRDVANERIQAVQAGYTTPRREFRHLRMDGSVFIAEAVGAPVEWNGQPAAQIIVRDMSERRRHEEILRQSEERLRAFADANVIGILVGDVHGNITECNEEYSRITGYPCSDFISGRIGWRDITPPESLPLDLQAIDTARRTGFTKPYEKMYRRKDGTLIPVLVGFALFGQKREQTVAFILDLSAQKFAENALVQANGAKDQFMAVLSHELRTPLTPILSTVQSMERSAGLSSEMRDGLEMIRRNVELEARLIDDLLDLTRISRGKLELHLSATNVHECISRVAEICGSDFRGKRQLFDVKLNAKRYCFNADAPRLQQILWNLLKNAHKFTPEDGMISLVTVDTSDGGLEILIRDSGIGIEAATLPRVFEVFEQGGRDVTRMFGGLGLGLAISKRLADAHGATLTAASEGRDTGATFTLIFPGRLAMTENVGSSPSDGEDVFRKGSILLVEDHEDTSKAMARLLRHSGHTVRVADTVASALQAAEADQFDLVVSDLGLPDGTGLDLMRQLLAKRPIKGIALSGFGMVEDIRQSREAGFLEHLTKPVNFDRLQAVITRIMGTAE